MVFVGSRKLGFRVMNELSLPTQCTQWPVASKPSLKIGTANAEIKKSLANAICWNSLGLFRDYGLNYIYFFRNKTFFFMMEIWNTKLLFEKESRETSQNFISIRWQIQNIEIKMVWMSWNFVRLIPLVSRTSFTNICWKCQLFILQNKKVLFLRQK